MNQITRVGLYIKPETRYRLNLLKAQLAVRLGRTVSQDEALDYLLDQVGIEAFGRVHPTLNGAASNGAASSGYVQTHLKTENVA